MADDISREDMERNLPRRVKAARIARKWSRDKLMDEAQVSEAVLNRVERGMLPSLPLLVRFAQAFGVSTDWLLTGQPSLMVQTDCQNIEDKSQIIIPDPTGAVG